MGISRSRSPSTASGTKSAAGSKRLERQLGAVVIKIGSERERQQTPRGAGPDGTTRAGTRLLARSANDIRKPVNGHSRQQMSELCLALEITQCR